MDLVARERQKYEMVWNVDAYRKTAPGEHAVEYAIDKLGIQKGDSLMDFGCGTGRATKKFNELGVHAYGVDIARNCLDKDVKILFQQACLWDLPNINVMWGYCTDVLEHIPPEKVPAVLDNIRASVVEGAFFDIHLGEDNFGERILGEPLHICIRDWKWWASRIEACFEEVEIEHDERSATFMCKKPFNRLKTNIIANTPRHEINANIEHAMTLDIPEFEAFKEGGVRSQHNDKLAIVGGGASLVSYLDELRGFDGKIMALNGTYKYLANLGIKADYFTLLDSRAENVEFVDSPLATTKHLISAQCNPAVFKALEGCDVELWYPMFDDGALVQGGKYPIGGGSTVGLRSIHLAVLMGYKPHNIKLYGYDSSHHEGVGHAYEQKLNEESQVKTTKFLNKHYMGTAPMLKQAMEYAEALHKVGYLRDIEVCGDGLIPDIYDNFHKELAEWQKPI